MRTLPEPGGGARWRSLASALPPPRLAPPPPPPHPGITAATRPQIRIGHVPPLPFRSQLRPIICGRHRHAPHEWWDVAGMKSGMVGRVRRPSCRKNFFPEPSKIRPTIFFARCRRVTISKWLHVSWIAAMVDRQLDVPPFRAQDGLRQAVSGQNTFCLR